MFISLGCCLMFLNTNILRRSHANICLRMLSYAHHHHHTTHLERVRVCVCTESCSKPVEILPHVSVCHRICAPHARPLRLADRQSERGYQCGVYICACVSVWSAFSNSVHSGNNPLLKATRTECSTLVPIFSPFHCTLFYHGVVLLLPCSVAMAEYELGSHALPSNKSVRVAQAQFESLPSPLSIPCLIVCS